MQKLGYFPDAVLNLITDIGAGFTVRETAGMDLNQLIAHVSHVLLCGLLNYNNNNNNNLIYIAPACRMTSEALADSSSRATECLTEK